MLLECCFEYICIKSELWRYQRNIYRLSSGKNGVSTVVFIKRREYYNLISGVSYAHHSSHHSFCTAAGNDYFRIRVELLTGKMLMFTCKSLTEILSSPCNGILVVVLFSYLCKTVEYLLWRLKIRKALRKVYCTVFI